MKISTKYWIIFYMSKIMYMLFAIFIYSKLTTLGDTSTYLNSNAPLNNFVNSTQIMEYAATLLNHYFGDVFAHVVFLSLSFYGIYYSVSRLALSHREQLYIFILLSLPSFGIWTSIVSKEAIGAFYMGIILGYFIDLLENKNRGIKLLEYFALVLLYIFKPQFFAAILSLFIFIKIYYIFNLKSTGISVLLCIHIILSILFFYYFRDYINELSFQIPHNFSINAGSTRENTIWVNNYDIFYNAPYGMFLAFLGPTLSEIIKKPIQSIAFIESSIIMIFFIYFLFKASTLVIISKKINVFYLSILVISVFWLLIVHYPFGVLNPGSAIRYRENFYGFLIVLIFYLYTKIKLRLRYEK